jgi:hypothetical protein
MSNSHAERPTQNCLPVIPSKLEDAVQSAVVPAHSKKGGPGARYTFGVRQSGSCRTAFENGAISQSIIIRIR